MRAVLARHNERFGLRLAHQVGTANRYIATKNLTRTLAERVRTHPRPWNPRTAPAGPALVRQFFIYGTMW